MYVEYSMCRDVRSLHIYLLVRIEIVVSVVLQAPGENPSDAFLHDLDLAHRLSHLHNIIGDYVCDISFPLAVDQECRWRAVAYSFIISL